MFVMVDGWKYTLVVVSSVCLFVCLFELPYLTKIGFGDFH